MAAPQIHVSETTPMGATLVAGGATFRVWAPAAREVHVLGEFNGWTRNDTSGLVRQSAGRWAGFIPGVADGTRYKLYVVGRGSEGFKRDPYARELTTDWPTPDCIIRSPHSYQWQDAAWRPPRFNDLICYQLHVGTFFGPHRERRVAKFLDLLDRVEYLADLGVNAIQLLPVVEYSTPRSMGYNGSDLFSPEMDYQAAEDELDEYLARVNRLLTRQGRRPAPRQQLAIPINQLKALVDVCHAYGLAVLQDVVFNHASGDVRGQDESIYFFDRQPRGNDNDSQYFTDQEHTGPVFAFWKPEVRQFLIDNARFFLEEYHVDGFRYDQVTVIDRQNAGSGWLFCQDLNATQRSADPSAINVAEYWGPEPAVVRARGDGGADFDGAWHDGLRTAIRGVIGQVTAGNHASMSWRDVAHQLRAPGFRNAWRAVQYLESHDEVYRGRNPRMVRLAGGGNSSTWHARSRARVALGLLATAPGIPMLFMGQEFLEHRQWDDAPEFNADSLIDWDALASDRAKIDFHRFTRELLWLRRRLPALRSEGVAVRLTDDVNRIFVFERWIPGVGQNVVVVASLNESTQQGRPVPFPLAGEWREVFNSDVYEDWVNPQVAGNGGTIRADGPPLNGLPASSAIVIPANGVLVFATD
jgi:1,4-alpha-glucan branching enzyme